MTERLEREMALLVRWFPQVEWKKDGEQYWLKVAEYLLPNGWNKSSTEVACLVPVAYPGAPPYGIYVPAGLLFNGSPPNAYTQPAPTQPPFQGTWGILSWAPLDGHWRPSVDVLAGSNLINWIRGFADRFKEGQ